MNDCPNAAIRDQLPDLLHDRLDPSARAAVTEHVGTCADCRDELELLQGIHGMLIARAPRIDVAGIVAALPRATARPAQPIRRRRSWSDWRVAAAITLFVVGGSSVVVYNRVGVSGGPASAPVIVDSGAQASARIASTTAAAVDPGSAATLAPAETVASAATDEGPAAGLGMAGHLANLNDRQLQALLDEIDQLQAVPITDPEPVSIKVEPRGALPSNGRGSE